jgi:hypothetical protein
MGDVVKLRNGDARPDHAWAREKAEKMIEGLRYAAQVLRSEGRDPQVLRPAAWNATKMAAWLDGTADEWTPEVVEQLLTGAREAK